MKNLLEKEIYETPVVMEISPVSYVAGQGETPGAGVNPDDDPTELGGD